jgi:hypothetical protein
MLQGMIKGWRKYRQDSDSIIKEILNEAETIAIVGLSNKPERDSYSVAKYLLNNGYRIIPVNPNIDSVFGLKAYPNLLSIPDEIDIDIVDIFRNPRYVTEVVEQAIRRGIKVIWMQIGVANSDAVKIAEKAGLKVIVNRCIKVEHMRLKDL